MCKLCKTLEEKHKVFIKACSNGDLEVVVEYLKDTRGDPSDRAIYEASKNGNLEIVKELMKDPRVDPSDCNNRAINWASHKNF